MSWLFNCHWMTFNNRDPNSTLPDGNRGGTFDSLVHLDQHSQDANDSRKLKESGKAHHQSDDSSRVHGTYDTSCCLTVIA